MNTELLETLAWVLIHSVWQGAVIASGVAAIGSTLSNPRIRHALALAGLGAVGAWSVYSALSIGAAEFEIGPMADGVSPAMASAPTVAAVMQTASQTTWATMIVQIWAVGTLVSLALVVRDLFAIGNMRRRAQAADPLPQAIVQLAERCAQRMGVRRALVRLSSDVGVPTVTGIWRPMILLPASALGLSPAQLEAVLLHELAHVRRHDLLVAALVRTMLVIYFFNPAVWWLDRKLRAERELCCDDLVVGADIETTVYSRALLALAEHRSVGLGLADTDGGLRHRIERLVGVPPRRRHAHPIAAAVVAAGLMLAGPASVAGPNKPSLLEQIQTAAETNDHHAITRLTAQATRHGTDEEKLLAYLYSGEMWFGDGDSKKALEWYEMVLELPTSPQHAFARYKAAWCHHNLGTTDTGIALLTEVSETGDRQLAGAARQDLVRFYVRAGREAEGEAWFTENGAAEVWEAHVDDQRKTWAERKRGEDR